MNSEQSIEKIEKYLKRVDVVIEPVAGSGSTLRACMERGLDVTTMKLKELTKNELKQLLAEKRHDLLTATTKKEKQDIRRDIVDIVFELDERESFSELIQKIKQWGIDRNIHTQDPKKQWFKLDEECKELQEALDFNNRIEIIDAIGDITVVLVQLSSQLDLEYQACVKAAYEEIKDRRGKMIDGVFVKEAE